MPGFSDLFGGLGDVIGSLFGGGSTSDPGSVIDPLSGAIDWSQTSPFDASSVFDNFVQPADILSNVPGLIDTPGLLGGFGDILGGLGGTVLGGLGGGAGGPVRSLLGGGGGSGSPAAGSPGAPQGRTASPGLVNPAIAAAGRTLAGGPPSGATGSSGGGIAGTISTLFSNPALAGMIPAIFQAINSKDQTNLGPDAAALRKIATGNQSQIDSLQGEAEAERMGNLPGPALATISQNLGEQKASFRTDYARMGMTGSSAEAADMAALNQKAEGERFQIGMSMSSEALNQVAGLNNQDVGIYGQLMSEQAQRDQEYMDAMAKLAEGIGKAFAGPANSPGASPGASVPTGGGNPVAGSGGGFTDPVAAAGGVGGTGDGANGVITGITNILGGGGGGFPTNVPDLVTPSLPDPSQIDPTTNPDVVAASDFLSQFAGFPQI